MHVIAQRGPLAGRLGQAASQPSVRIQIDQQEVEIGDRRQGAHREQKAKRRQQAPPRPLRSGLRFGDNRLRRLFGHLSH